MAKKIQIEYCVFDDPETLARETAQHLVEGIRSAAAARGVARIAISGGSTPKSVFALLADEKEPFRAAIPWDRLRLFWVMSAASRRIIRTATMERRGICC